MSKWPWGLWIPLFNLWMNHAVTHRQVCPQKKSLVINGAEVEFSTELIQACGALLMKFFPRRVSSLVAGLLAMTGTNTNRGQKKAAPKSGFVANRNPMGSLANAEAGENPAQQVIRAECSGNFTQHLLCLAQILCKQLTGTGEGQLRTAMLEVGTGLA